MQVLGARAGHTTRHWPESANPRERHKRWRLMDQTELEELRQCIDDAVVPSASSSARAHVAANLTKATHKQYPCGRITSAILMDDDAVLQDLVADEAAEDAVGDYPAARATRLRAAIRRRRLECAPPPPPPLPAETALTARCCFTAPHTLILRRDDEPDHRVEDFTWDAARLFADACGGGVVRWAQSERETIRKLGRADPTNRDPNYLRDAELFDSPWLQARFLASRSFCAIMYSLVITSRGPELVHCVKLPSLSRHSRRCASRAPASTSSRTASVVRRCMWTCTAWLTCAARPRPRAPT